MSLARWSVNRPLTTWMLVIGICVLGAMSLIQLPLALVPDFQFPVAVVITEYPNVGPFEVEAQVSVPIEEALSTVSGVTRVSSQTQPGLSIVIAEFDWGTDMDFAALEMRERVDAIRGFLPDGAEAPLYLKFDISGGAMYEFSVSGPMDLATLRHQVDEVIRPRLERIEGVGSVDLIGGLERQIRIAVDQARLDAWGVNFQQLAQALVADNLNLPAGSMREGGRRLLLRTLGEYQTIEEIEETVVGATEAGVIRVRDVADVEDAFKEQRQITRLNGRESITVSIQKESAANTVSVSNAVNAELARLKEEFAGVFDFQTVWDEADFIRQSIRSVIENALVGALAAMIVLFLFLKRMRPTLVVGVSVPVAGVATFFSFYILDVSLNVLSMAGLALGLGMLVDNAIVCLENIVRHRALGKTSAEAAVDGAEEVGGALQASTFTTVAVFFPILFVGGLAAEIFTDLALAVSVSLGISLLVALTFVPMISAKSGLTVAERNGRVFELVQRGHRAAVRWLLDHRWAAVAGVALLAALAVIAAPRIGTEFFPEVDTGEFTVNVRLPRGSTRDATNEVVSRIEDFLAGIEDVESVAVSISAGSGAGIFFGGSGGNEEVGTLRAVMRPQSERSVHTETVVEQVRAFAAGIPGARVTAAMTDFFGVGGLGGDAPIVINLLGRDIDELNRSAEMVAEAIRRIDATRDVTAGTSEGRPELQIVVDRVRAGELGLTAGQIAQSVRNAVDGVTVTRFRSGGRGEEIDVVLQLEDRWRQDRFALEELKIQTPFGGSVPLREAARIVEGMSPAAIARLEQLNVVTVTSRFVGAPYNQVLAEIEEAIAGLDLPPGVIYQFGGDDEQMQEAFSDLFLAFILAVALTYMLLVAQFESLSQPFIIMASVPLGLVGVVLSLWATGQNLSVPGLVGLILMAGVVVNNGIVMVDYINRLRSEGHERRQAVLTGVDRRLRPILMTTATTVLGMFPLSLGIGEGAELQQPIAIVVMGGLTFSTALTLVFTPVLYTLVDDFSLWLRQVAGRLLPASARKAAMEEGA